MTAQANTPKTARNNAVDIFRLVCAMLVVCVHTQLFYEINANLNYFCTKIFPRIVMPFFFSVSGYYFIGSLISGEKVYIRYLKKLLIVYSLWSIIYFSLTFFNLIVLNHQPITDFIKQCALNFFIYGSYYQLWFFPAIFLSATITTICYKLKIIKWLVCFSLFLYIVGCLGCSYYTIGNRIPVISGFINSTHFDLIRRYLLTGLPFFLLGYFLNTIRIKKDKKLIAIFIITAIIYLAEIFYVVKTGLQENISLTLFLYPLATMIIICLINNPLPKFIIFGKRARTTANFMFYSHPIFILLLEKLFNLSGTPLFLLVVLLTGASGFMIAYINKKWINIFIA